jgi:hypothetical protein
MTAKKAPAKKPAKKVAPQVPPTRELYSASCKIEELSMNLDKAIAVIDLIQEASLFPGSNANALWAAVDIVEDVRNKLDDLVKSLVEEHRRIHGIKHEFHNDF